MMDMQGVALTKVPKVKFLIIIGGAKFRAPSVVDKAYASPISCPSLHFLGNFLFLFDFLGDFLCFVLPSFVHTSLLSCLLLLLPPKFLWICFFVYFAGDLDFLKPYGAELLESCVEPVVIKHPKGHTIPRIGTSFFSYFLILSFFYPNIYPCNWVIRIELFSLRFNSQMMIVWRPWQVSSKEFKSYARPIARFRWPSVLLRTFSPSLVHFEAQCLRLSRVQTYTHFLCLLRSLVLLCVQSKLKKQVFLTPSVSM